METTYTIGQLARAAGVPTSTVRYYERIELLQPAGRTAGNYRLYGADALEQLRFIRTAQATGFALEDIMYLRNFRSDDPAVCHDVQILIEARLADLEQRMADLRHVQRVLKTTLERCRKMEWQGLCQVIERLTATSLSHP
jgi:DNA-binding transcriptional MerR regulator